MYDYSVCFTSQDAIARLSSADYEEFHASGDTLCKVTLVILQVSLVTLHGVSPVTLHGVVSPVTLHGVVSPDSHPLRRSLSGFGTRWSHWLGIGAIGLVDYELVVNWALRPASERRRETLRGCKDFYLKPGPENGPDWLACAAFARQRPLTRHICWGNRGGGRFTDLDAYGYEGAVSYSKVTLYSIGLR